MDTYSTKHTGPFERIRFPSGRLPWLFLLLLLRCWPLALTLCRNINKRAIWADMRKSATVVKLASSLLGEELADRFARGGGNGLSGVGSGGRS